MACPSEQRLLDYVDGALPATEREDVDAHVDRCRRCQMAVAQLVGSEDEPEHEPGDGPRYEIVRELGAGAMGIVYEATDLRLARRVALKMLKPGRAGSVPRSSADARGRLRIAREGRALARLDHPGIVSVFDIGVLDGETCVAMQYVDGVTLRHELEGGALDWRRAVELAIGIAEAVAAAHSVGVVHRDLKPDNVMLEDGAPKVLDFGLAHAGQDPPQNVSIEMSRSDHDLDVTATGTVVGTPAYMAPEAMAGQRSDERGDQYSLFVVLFEMVYGRRPFRGGSLAELWDAKRQRATTHGPDPDVPRWLRRTILRGLSPDPDDRFASLHEVVTVLRRGRAPAHRVGTLVVAGTVVGVTLVWTGGEQASRCGGAAERVAKVYANGDRDAIVTRRDDGRRIVEALDDYAAQWAKSSTRTCAAAWIEGTMSLAELDATTACLDAGLGAMATVVEAAREPTIGVAQVLEVIAEAEIDACNTSGTGGQRSLFRGALLEQLARARALATLGDDSESAVLAREVAERADRIGAADVEARAWFVLGIAWQSLERFEDAVESQREAYFTAGRAGDHGLASDAASALAYALGGGLGDGATAMQWIAHADAASERAGVAPMDSLRLTGTRGLLLDVAGRTEEALVFHRRALVLSEGSEHLGNAHMNVANALSALGRIDAAAEHYAAAIDASSRAFGASHSSTLAAEINAIASQLERGLDEDALVAINALEPRITASGQLIWQSRLLSMRGMVLRRMGRYEEAVECQAEALAISEKKFGPEHRDVAADVLNLSVALQAAGRCEQALEAARRARRLWPTALPGAAFDHAAVHLAVARALGCLGRAGESLDAAQAVLVALGPDPPPSPALVDALFLEGVAAEMLGRNDEARAAFERALSLADVARTPDELRVALRDGVVRLRE